MRQTKQFALSMQSALNSFNQSIARVRHLHGLHVAIGVHVTVKVDLSDILRAELVMSVSALDRYVHDLTLLGMLECWAGVRPKTDAFNRFSLPMSVMGLMSIALTAEAALENEIRFRHAYLTFQQPDKIADAIRLFSPVALWDGVAIHIGKPAQTIKATLGLIVDRRNKIAHEADVDPSYSGQLWQIDPPMVEQMVNDVESIAHAIHAVSA
jgi:hypothetical protein